MASHPAAPPPTPDTVTIVRQHLLGASATPPSPLSQLSEVADVLGVTSGGGNPPPAIGDALPIPGVAILVLLFIYFASYFFRDGLHRHVAGTRLAVLFGGGEGGESEERLQGKKAGLDPAVLASFPVAPYATVMGVTEGKGWAECAVCLTEFAGGDHVRVLTVCCHAFHPECIDPWLEEHATCPACRADLETMPDDVALRAVMEAAGDSHFITIAEEGEGAGFSKLVSGQRRRDGENEGEQEVTNG